MPSKPDETKPDFRTSPVDSWGDLTPLQGSSWFILQVKLATVVEGDPKAPFFISYLSEV